jgi:hypothetical protein
METGANANTWGNNTNTNLETLDAFSAGYLSKSVAGSANVTLTSNNADPTAEASNKVIEFSGALTGNIYVFIPAVENNYIFFNNTSGAYTLTIAPTGHSANGVVITQGAHTIMYNNANNEIKDLFSGSLGDLSLVSGGVFTGNASGASALNASNVSSGTIADARLTANVTLNNASTISAGTLADARLTANVTLNNASTISAGTLSNDRLDTVPTTKGGTGLTSVGSSGQVLTVTAPGALAFQDAGGGGGYEMTLYTSPATYAPPADLVAVKVTVVGAGGSAGTSVREDQSGKGGNGGAAFEYIPAASIPGPVSVTAGTGTSSFGAFVSATAGSNSSPASGSPTPNANPGSGSGGQYNSQTFPASYDFVPLGMGAKAQQGNYGGGPGPQGFQHGGGGGPGRPPGPGSNTVTPGGQGAPGVVIVEEFF